MAFLDALGRKITKVQKRDGRVVDFDESRIARAIGLASEDANEPGSELQAKLAKKVTNELNKEFKGGIPNVEQIQDMVERILIEEGHAKIAKAYILHREKHAELRRQRAGILGFESDLKLSTNALTVLKTRYLRRDRDGNVIESPLELFMRVAANISQADLNYDPHADTVRIAHEFTEMMSSLDFLPSTAMLMNAGNEPQQLFACFVLPVPDSIEGIFEAVKQQAMIQKNGAGTGFSFSRLRPRGELVSTIKAAAAGPVAFMRVFDATATVVRQGGKRQGGNMGILRVDHPDILDFITVKRDMETLRNFNISVGLTEAFVAAVEKDELYEIKHPISGAVVRKLRAEDVFNLMISEAWRNGDPGIIFLDRYNEAKSNPTPYLGKIEATSPCAEQALLPNEGCVLGSINLSNMVKEGQVDWAKLKLTTQRAVHFLDNAIDLERYPNKEAERMSRFGNRKIGLGIMGWADMLFRLRIPYHSDKAINMAEEVMDVINESARDASGALALIRGVFPNWKGSVYDKESSDFCGIDLRLRNASLTTISPTGTISMIADTSSGIEPVYGLSYDKHVLDGQTLRYSNSVFEEALKEAGVYSLSLMQKVQNAGSINPLSEIPIELREVFVTAHDISPYWHVKMQAAFQKHTDNAVSKTVNFPASATIKNVEEVYLFAYKLGCKGVTIYRDLSRDTQVLNVDTSSMINDDAGESHAN